MLYVNWMMTNISTLNAEETNETVAEWVSEAIKCDDVTRRLHARYSFRHPATFSRGGLEIIGMCRDISKSGIGLLQHECPPVEGPLNVVIWIDRRMFELDVDIRWRQDLGNGWWASGGRLIRCSLGVSTLLRARIRGLVERRLHKRYPHCVAIDLCAEVCSSSRESAGEQAFVLSQDTSVGGMSILSSLQVKLGSIVYLRPSQKQSAGFVRGRTVSTSALENGYYLIRLEFENRRGLMSELPFSLA